MPEKTLEVPGWGYVNADIVVLMGNILVAALDRTEKIPSLDEAEQALEDYLAQYDDEDGE